MRLLLDTHVFVWATSTPENLSTSAREAIEEPDNEVIVSTATVWEICIKYALGKIELPAEPAIFIPARVAQLGFHRLPIEYEHALAIRTLPKHHNDPFDRILVAQAQVENLTLVSADTSIFKYPVHILKT